MALLAGCGGGSPRHTVKLQMPSSVSSTTTPATPATTAPKPPPPPRPGIEWPTYGYDNTRDRVAPFDVRPPLRKIWTWHGQTLLEFPPAVAYGDVYDSTFSGTLYGIDAQTGKAIWRYHSGRCGWSSPAVADGLVFATFIGSYECGSNASDGEVVAFNALTGHVRWLHHIGPSESSPLVEDGRVFVGDWNGVVTALDARTGATVWTTQTQGAIKGSIASSGGHLYIGTYDGDLYSLDARNGSIVWQQGGYGSLYSSPALADGKLFIGSLNGDVYAFSAGSGSLQWQRSTGGYVYASAAVWHGLVLIGSYDNVFYAFNAGDGSTRWSYSADGEISGSASVIDGIVYFSTFNEHTYALDASSGNTVETWNDGKYSPAVADDGHIYLVGLGRLYAEVPSGSGG